MTNDTANGPGIRLPWAGKLVRIEEIEQTLTSLWSMSHDNLRTGANINVRTSVLNLVICTPDLETAQLASKVLRDLSSTHLARVAIVALDSNEPVPSISAWVTLRCFSMISDLMRHCFEQTTLLTKGSATRAAGNILQPLLKPDLPVYLWWLGDPPDQDDPTFHNLVDLSNRIIFDSTSFFAPEQDIRTLAALCKAAPDSALSDLNWGRLTSWRELVIQFFDVPEYRPYLSGIQSIEIEHAAAPLAAPGRTDEGDVSPNPTRALLLAAWLKERLGWPLSAHTANNHHDTASGSYHWEMQRMANQRVAQLASPRTKSGRLGSRPGSITIRPKVRSEMRPGSIVLVRLVSIADNKEAIFTISRDADLDHVYTSVELEQETRQKRIVSLTTQHKESDLLRDELEITGHDYLYEQTLQEVADLLDAER
ncbi:MAG TPA: glucose-6-phosphate dehydrogenase assembly protein OpcA [Ktedonobacteraceae bacterium]|nr:glucose-6-phosphate dehydrogenase assembly protein OpcA [Ktedonobacteraceae bacterium]